MAFSISIGGTNITNYIAYQGLKWQRNDVDASDAGRTMDGLMHRGRVATKIRLDITCRPLTSTEANTLLNLILPETVSVTYTDPMYGSRTATFYSNNNPASYMQLYDDGTERWSEITFPLVEV